MERLKALPKKDLPKDLPKKDLPTMQKDLPWRAEGSAMDLPWSDILMAHFARTLPGMSHPDSPGR